MRRFTFLFLMLIFMSLFPQSVYAVSLPDNNNKFGIHVATLSDEDIQAASNLVNSNGGQWGYVVAVLQKDDYDAGKWQEFFDKLRQQKLLPCIRLATHIEGVSWKRPDDKDAITAAHFLNNLNWPTRMQCVILFNEPNHGSEWGGSCDGEDFVARQLWYAKTFKLVNEDFFLLSAGLDQIAPSAPPNFCDAGSFIKTMVEKTPAVFDFLDGWSSHSYPNPGFSASPSKRGRASIAGYDWELQLLKSYGITKNLPVFITETGWTSRAVSQDQIARYYQTAFEQVWLPDTRVQAVVPFLLTYIGEPFQQFSLRRPEGGDSFFPSYDTIRAFPKSASNPVQIEKASIMASLPRVIVGDSLYRFQVWVRNDGQAIWDKRDGYELKVMDTQPFDVQLSELFNVLPKRSTVITMQFDSNGYRGVYTIPIGLYKKEALVLKLFSLQLDIVDNPSAQLGLKQFPGLDVDGEIELQIFDKDEQLVYKKSGVQAQHGVATVEKIVGVALDQPYRFVVIKKGYLPRQTHATLHKGVNGIAFDMLLPGDFNNDGKLSISDLLR